jgi:hypothetical protein
MLRDVWRVLVAWWAVDRVRCSPADGRLLRVVPPCLVRVRGDIWEIVSRVVGEDAEGGFVVYRCAAGRELSARPLVRGVALSIGGVELDEVEVEVIG